MLLEAAQDLLQRPSGGGEQELVLVEEGDPARVVAMPFHAIRVCLELPREHRPLVVDDEPTLDVGRQHFEVVVLAEIVVEKEALHPDKTVEFDPLGKVVRVVAIDREQREI